jgi:hypothetical protein
MTHPWRIDLIGSILAAAMLASLVLVLGGVVQRFMPGWNPYYLGAASALVALESAFVQLVIRRERMSMGESARYLAAELAALAVLMRVVATLSVGLQTLGAAADVWLRTPLTAFTDGPFVGCMLVGVLVALGARGVASGLQDLAVVVAQPGDSLLHGVNRAAIAADRVAALRLINNRFVGGGVLLLLSLSIQMVNIQQIGGPSLPLSLNTAVAALIYLICGFLLYSQARLALLTARWQSERSTIEPAVLRRWNRSSIVLVGLLSFVLLALPRNYGLGLLDTIRLTLGTVGAVLAFLGYAMLWLISSLALLPMLLFAWLFPSETVIPAPPADPPMPPPLEQVAGQPPLIPSLIFWLCIALLAGYALWTVAQRHPGLRRLFDVRGPLAALRRWLASLWGDTAAWANLALARAALRVRRMASAPRSAAPRLRLGGLTPRDLVLACYRAVLTRAAGFGLPRRRGQTPLEYRETLSNHVPDLQSDIDQLTDAFMAAEYGPRTPNTDAARAARTASATLRRRLRPKKP